MTKSEHHCCHAGSFIAANSWKGVKIKLSCSPRKQSILLVSSWSGEMLPEVQQQQRHLEMVIWLWLWDLELGMSHEIQFKCCNGTTVLLKNRCLPDQLVLRWNFLCDETRNSLGKETFGATSSYDLNAVAYLTQILVKLDGYLLSYFLLHVCFTSGTGFYVNQRFCFFPTGDNVTHFTRVGNLRACVEQKEDEWHFNSFWDAVRGRFFKKLFLGDVI